MRKYLIVLVTLFWIINLNAQNFVDALRVSETDLGIGAKSLSMGGAFIAISDDYTAAYYNPAGLFQIRQMEFSGSLNYQRFSNQVSFLGNSNTISKNKMTVGNFGLVFPFPTFRGSFVISIGYNLVRNLNSINNFEGFNAGNNSMIQNLLGKDDIAHNLGLTDSTGFNTPINGHLLQEGSITNNGLIHHWSFSGAIEVAKNLSLGVSLNLLNGTFTKEREYSESDSKNNYDNVRTNPSDPKTLGFHRFDFFETLKWELGGVGVKTGLMYKYKDFLNLGLTVKFPEVYTIKDKYYVDAGASYNTGFSPKLNPSIAEEVEYEIYTPYEFGFGLAATKYNLILSGDINLVDFTEMEFRGFSNKLNNQKNKEIKDLFRTVVNYNIGLDYLIPFVKDFDFIVRAGFANKTSPYKDDPSQFDKKYLTFGLGGAFENTFSIDLAYVYSWYKTFGDNYGTNVSRTYQDIKTHNVIISMKYIFKE